MPGKANPKKLNRPFPNLMPHYIEGPLPAGDVVMMEFSPAEKKAVAKKVAWARKEQKRLAAAHKKYIKKAGALLRKHIKKT